VDPGRQRLSQRRKAAALTQGSRTDLLAPERPTAIRQETGNTQPPPPKRPNAASGPQVSMRQLADLFTESKTDATRAPATNADEPSRALIRPPAAAKPELREPTQAQHPYRSSPAAPPARSWRLKRIPAAGLLAAALAGGASSVLMGPPHSVPGPPDSAGTPTLTAPVAAIPVPDAATATSSPTKDAMGAVQPAPATEADKPLDSTTSSRTITVPSPPEAQIEHRTTIRRKPSAPAVTAPSSNRPTPAEAYDAWARAAGFDRTEQHWPDVRREPPSHR
jgi:hypothetical protein